MIEFGQASLISVSIHMVGNKLREEGTRLSGELAKIDDEETLQLLYRYLLRPFAKVENLYHFVHPTSIELNEVYHYVSKIFGERSEFHNQSKNIALQLYECSMHPRIREGEFFMIYLENCAVNDQKCDAVGIFRTENKETYLKVLQRDESFGMSYDRGISVNHLDKGCLIFNTNKTDGYRVAIVDTHSRAADEARYWKDAFLQVGSLRTESVVTQDYLRTYSQFGQTSMGRDEELALQARTIDYFENNDVFELKKFVQDVVGDNAELQQRFIEMRQQVDSDDSPLPERFEIAHDKVQKFRRRLRNQIKLDDNFEIVIKGLDLEEALRHVEKGFDQAKSRHFYKLYFDHEQ